MWVNIEFFSGWECIISDAGLGYTSASPVICLHQEPVPALLGELVKNILENAYERSHLKKVSIHLKVTSFQNKQNSY